MLAALGILGSWPAGQAVAVALQTELLIVPRWALTQLVATLIQLSLAVYLAQLPDSSSARMVAAWGLVLSTVYAGLVGWLSIAGPADSFIIWLDLAAPHTIARARAWSFILLCLTGALTLAAGRLAAHWE